MNLFRLPSALLTLIALPLANAQYPPPPTYQNVLTSPVNPNITISYKQPPAGTCTTAFSTQKQYTGYIELPPFTLAPIQQNYSINTFFWFVEARQTPESAPLTIYLNGGPGTSSMFGLFNEVGPCEVVQLADGTYGTQVRPWGWDRISNILFIDQPNQVGFSYDVPINASYNLFTNDIFEPPTPNSQLPNFMYLNGTFGSGSVDDEVPYASTANTTQIAAAATWHFLQAWLSTFTQYNPATRPNVTTPNSYEPAGINLFTESYGGKFGPAFAEYFEQQNEAIANGTLPRNSTLTVELLSVGIMNGLVDNLIQDYYYPLFLYNNTYGIQGLSQTAELNALNSFTTNCKPAIQACRSAGANIYGDVSTINSACKDATWTCNNITALAVAGGFDPYDIRQKYPSPFPPAAYQEYLNNGSVLQAIGARINFTESNPYVFEGFTATGDSVRGGMVEALADLLSRNIRVALIYGDADYLCNWYGGEAISYAVANAVPNYPSASVIGPSSSASPSPPPPPYSSGFASAGYAQIVVNDTYIGGAVKQYGNLSFSRIYDSGHFIPYFQPATAFQVFARIILGNEISTGEPINLSLFGSSGPANATFTNKPPAATPSPTCWVRSWNASCSGDDTNALLAGQGLVQNGIYYQDRSSISLPTSSVMAGVPGEPLPTSAIAAGTFTASDGSMRFSGLTGVYTATATPTSTKKGGAGVSGRRPPVLVGDGILGWGGVVLGGMVIGGMIVL